MRRSWRQVIGVLAVLGWSTAVRGHVWAADSAKVCTEHLVTIGRALTKYQQEHGSYPADLSVLYPRYVKQKSVLLCPADRSRTRRTSTSYNYEMILAKTSRAGIQLGYYVPKANSTWRDVNVAQRANFGDAVPVVRCWHHAVPSEGNFVLNLTASGRVYRTGPMWEFDPRVFSSVLEYLERDLKAGPARFASRWNAQALHGYIEAVRSVTFPRPGGVPQPVRQRLVRVAGRLESLAAASKQRSAPFLHMSAGSAYWLGGAMQLAAASYEKAMASPEVRQEAGLTLARLYESAGQPERAAESLARVDPGAKLVGSKAPDFELKDVSGKAVRLSEFTGKVVLLDFLTFG